jgi:anti-sigma B factor antagonist
MLTSAATIARLPVMQGSPTPPRIERVPAPAGTAVLVLAGELDLATAGRFRDLADSAIGEGVQKLVLDMSETTFLDSTMLRELLRTNTALQGNGGKVVLVGAQAAVDRLLELTGTAELFGQAATRADALGP